MYHKLFPVLKKFASACAAEIKKQNFFSLLMLSLSFIGTFVLVCFDKNAAEFIQRNSDEKTMIIMKKISRYGGYQGVLVLCSIVLMIGMLKKKKKIINAAIAALIAASSAGLTANIIKFPIGRPRPKTMMHEGIPDGLYGPTFNSRYQGFPSAHTACAFGAATAVSAAIPQIMLPSFLIAVTVSFSRYYTKNHYPSDIYFSIILGIFFGFFSVRIMQRFADNKTEGA